MTTLLFQQPNRRIRESLVSVVRTATTHPLQSPNSPPRQKQPRPTKRAPLNITGSHRVSYVLARSAPTHPQECFRLPSAQCPLPFVMLLSAKSLQEAPKTTSLRGPTRRFALYVKGTWVPETKLLEPSVAQQPAKLPPTSSSRLSPMNPMTNRASGGLF